MSVIGDNIAARRKALGMTQEELAKKVGLNSRSAITQIEKGHNNVNQVKVELFAQALRTTPEVLMGWAHGDLDGLVPILPVKDGSLPQREKVKELIALVSTATDEELEQITDIAKVLIKEGKTK